MNRLKELRGEISQEKIAQKLGISQRAYSNYETGTREPDIETMIKLADYFGVTIDYLFGRSDEPNTSLKVPEEYKNLSVAFYEGAKGLSQDDIDDVIRYMEFKKHLRGETNDSDSGKNGN